MLRTSPSSMSPASQPHFGPPPPTIEELSPASSPATYNEQPGAPRLRPQTPSTSSPEDVPASVVSIRPHLTVEAAFNSTKYLLGRNRTSSSPNTSSNLRKIPAEPMPNTTVWFSISIIEATCSPSSRRKPSAAPSAQLHLQPRHDSNSAPIATPASCDKVHAVGKRSAVIIVININYSKPSPRSDPAGDTVARVEATGALLHLRRTPATDRFAQSSVSDRTAISLEASPALPKSKSPSILLLVLEPDGEVPGSDEDNGCRDDACDNSPKTVGSDVDSKEKVVVIKLRKLKNVDGGGSRGKGSSGGDRNLDRRRCFSVGSFEYVMDETSTLQVPIKPTKKKSQVSKPEHWLVISECDGNSRRESASISSQRKVASFRLSGSKVKDCSSWRTVTKLDVVGWSKNGSEFGECGSDMEAGRYNYRMGSQAEKRDLLERFVCKRTLMWIAGRQNKRHYSDI